MMFSPRCPGAAAGPSRRHRVHPPWWIAVVAACGGDNLTAPAAGVLEISTATTGFDLDPDGYAVQIDGRSAEALAVGATLRRGDLTPGLHVVLLQGVADNCAVEGDNPRAVNVARGETASVVFAIACRAVTGSLAIRTSTMGTADDPDGYAVALDGTDREALPANGEVTLAGLPPGPYAVSLSGKAAGCKIDGANPVEVTIELGIVSVAQFDVTCMTPPPALQPGGPGLPAPLPASDGRAFFVAPDGSDENYGTIRAPWRTMQKAMDDLKPGQLAYVRAGTYETGGAFGTEDDHYEWDTACTVAEPCSIVAYPGEHPVLHGQVRIRGQGLRLSGFIIEGPLSADVASCSGRRANQVDVVGASWIEISYNEIRDNDYHAGINVSFGNRVQIVGNRIHRNGRFSLERDPCNGNEVYETDHGIYWEDAGFAGENLVANNLVYGNRGKGIQFFGGAIGGVVISHNTIVGNGNTGLLVDAEIERITVVNNISAFNGITSRQQQMRVREGDDILLLRNLTYALDESVAGIEADDDVTLEDNSTEDPGLADPSGADLRLLPGSPALDAAAAEFSVATDIEGTVRPVGAGADLGAYER